MNDADRLDLAIQDLRGRIVALAEGRRLLPNWITIESVIAAIDEWEGDFSEEPPSFVTRSTYRMVDVPVVAGVAMLPDGRTVASTAQIVRVPVLVTETEP